MEFFDCLDLNGNKTGEAVSREMAHRKGISHGASHIFIYRKNKGEFELLLQRRSANKDSYPNMLDISSAGHVSSGFNYLQTAIKETKEELGLDIAADQLEEVYVFHFHNEAIFNNEPFINDEFAQVYLLDGSFINKDELVLQKEEVSEVNWYSLKQIYEMLEKNDGECCLVKTEIDRIVEVLYGKN